MTTSPVADYRARREARQETDARLGRVDALIAYSRLAAFVAIVVVAILGWKSHAFSGLWLLAPVVAFIALVVIHDRVIRARRRAEWAVRFYADGIARLEDRPPPGTAAARASRTSTTSTRRTSTCSASGRSTSGCPRRARRWARRRSPTG